MPNHQTTIIITTPNVAAGFMRDSTEEERASKWSPAPDRVVDFELLIPMPDEKDPMFTCEIHEYPGGARGYGAGYSPLDWARENWGTKWNAYDQSYEALSGDLVRIQFDTAWSCPFPVLYALSAKFPDEVISVETADEDLGGGVAIFKLKGGEEFDVDQPDEYSEEAKEHAARIKYGMTYAELRAEYDEEDEADVDSAGS